MKNNKIGIRAVFKAVGLSLKQKMACDNLSVMQKLL